MLLYLKKKGGKYMMISIASWDYMLTRNPDGSFRLWHHVTPADGGYGREVDIMLPADYFKKNSARDFYEQIAPLQMIPVSNYSKEADIKALASALKAANLR
jgi:hypothetical protein